MIDFRYHLVSLISVFLALAVGIILGAGPLQGTLGETLTRQVDSLREERNDLRAQLDATTGFLQADETFLAAAAPRLLDGALAGRHVAVVSLGEVPAATRSGVTEQLEAAGADVVGTARLPVTWTSVEEETSQETVAEGLRRYLTDAGIETPRDEPATTLGAAVALALVGTGPAGSRSDDAVDLESQLERFDLLDVAGEQTAPADAVVLLTAAPVTEDGAEASAYAALGTPEPEPEPTVSPSAEPASPRHAGDVWTAAAAGASLVSGTLVLSGPAGDGDDPVQRVRSDDELARDLTTVSDPASLVGQVTVPLALAAASAGQDGHYGPEADATAIPPVPGE
ncbi:copper transporter [Myceligenerans crystallogenes]|uniref:Copper transporter n=1 Tax=Myceligenerans crystallogenes TaxID=316335 RepID=A0ABP4ZSR9_9MICO